MSEGLGVLRRNGAIREGANQFVETAGIVTQVASCTEAAASALPDQSRGDVELRSGDVIGECHGRVHLFQYQPERLRLVNWRESALWPIDDFRKQNPSRSACECPLASRVEREQMLLWIAVNRSSALGSTRDPPHVRKSVPGIRSEPNSSIQAV